MAINSEMTVKGTEIIDSATLAKYMGYLDLITLKIILGSFSALISAWLLTQKRQVIEQNRLKFVTWGITTICTEYLLSRRVQGNFWIIRFTCQISMMQRYVMLSFVTHCTYCCCQAEYQGP